MIAHGIRIFLINSSARLFWNKTKMRSRMAQLRKARQKEGTAKRLLLLTHPRFRLRDTVALVSGPCLLPSEYPSISMYVAKFSQPL